MDVRIDRLRLQVSGMSQDTARQFGRLVAERLGALLAAESPAPGAARAVPQRVAVRQRVSAPQRVSVPRPAQDSPGALAAAVAAEIARTLRAQVTR